MNTNKTSNFPRPVRRACRVLHEVVELTPAGLKTTRSRAERTVNAALDAYSDAGAQLQEGGTISPQTWDALGERLNRSTRLVATCAKQLQK